MSEAAIHSESTKTFKREWSKGGKLLQFFYASIVTLPAIFSHIDEINLVKVFFALLCPGLFVLGGHLVLLYNRYEITDDALKILPSQQYDHSHIQKERIRSFEIIEQNWISRSLLGTRKRVIYLRYDMYEETILYSTDPELIAWLEDVVEENRNV